MMDELFEDIITRSGPLILNYSPDTNVFGIYFKNEDKLPEIFGSGTTIEKAIESFSESLDIYEKLMEHHLKILERFDGKSFDDYEEEEEEKCNHNRMVSSGSDGYN